MLPRIHLRQLPGSLSLESLSSSLLLFGFIKHQKKNFFLALLLLSTFESVVNAVDLGAVVGSIMTKLWSYPLHTTQLLMSSNHL
jgi:hypothetical protein